MKTTTPTPSAERAQLLARIDPELHQRAKVFATLRGQSMADLVAEALAARLKRADARRAFEELASR